jgi:hypothetical protein
MPKSRILTLPFKKKPRRKRRRRFRTNTRPILRRWIGLCLRFAASRRALSGEESGAALPFGFRSCVRLRCSGWFGKFPKSRSERSKTWFFPLAAAHHCSGSRASLCPGLFIDSARSRKTGSGLSGLDFAPTERRVLGGTHTSRRNFSQRRVPCNRCDTKWSNATVAETTLIRNCRVAICGARPHRLASIPTVSRNLKLSVYSPGFLIRVQAEKTCLSGWARKRRTGTIAASAT